jgi:hypothetical protein
MATYVNVGTRVSSAGNTSATPGLPASRVNGNVLIAVCGTKNNATHSTSTGNWRKIDQVNSGTGWTLSLFAVTVDGTESAPAISWSGSVANFAIIAQYSGTSGAIGAITPNSGTGSPHTNAGFNATRDNSQPIYIGGATTNTAYGTTTGWSENADAGSNTGATRHVFGRRNATINTGAASGSTSSTGSTGAWVMYQIEMLAAYAAIGADKGTINLTGKDADLKKSWLLTAEKGSYALTGKTVDLTVGGGTQDYTIEVEKGSLALSGKNADLKASRVLTAEKGSYTTSGKNANLTAQRQLSGDKGQFTLTGKDAELTYTPALTYTLSAEKGTFTTSGKTADLKADRKLLSDKATFNLTGKDATIKADRKVLADKGTFSVTGKDADLIYEQPGAYILPAQKGSFVINGSPANQYKGSKLTCQKASFTLSGKDVEFVYSRGIAAEKGNFALSGKDATLTYQGFNNYVLTAEKGGYILTGKQVDLIAPFILPPIVGKGSFSNLQKTLKNTGGFSSIKWAEWRMRK